MSLIDIIFPRTCVGCGRWSDYICSKCINKINIYKNSFCPVCEKGSIAGVTHTKCKSRYSLNGVTVFGEYNGLLKHYLHDLKYGFVTDSGQTLTDIIISLKDLSYLFSKKWLYIPIPLHSSRHRWRGFNQSEIIASNLADYSNTYYSSKILVRHKNTKSQASLDAESRVGNVKNIFSLSQEVKLQDAEILLIDDVWTTGSTLREACKVLKKAGAKTVWGFVVAS